MPFLSNLDETDPTFVHDLKLSKDAVWALQKWLVSEGYTVMVKPILVRPTVEERGDYADSGDLEIVQTIECKHRLNVDFTCREDYPYKTVFVDEAQRYDRKQPKPYAYMLLNKSMTHVALIRCTSAGKWEKVKKFDKGKERIFYHCPLKYVTFRAM